MQVKIHGTVLNLVQGDITKQEVEAVVNAANTGLRGGSGVDGAIHRAGGPAIMEECRQIREKQGGCPVGQAVITTGGDLPARYVIHTVGPVWNGGNNKEDELLASAYRSSLELAKEKGIETLAFPSISTGAYRFPLERAAKIALSTVKKFLTENAGVFREVRFVLFSQDILEVYEHCLHKLRE